jgi:hypothetical protein
MSSATRSGAMRLIGANCVLAIVLTILQRLFSSATQRLEALMLMNAIVGAGGVCLSPTECWNVFARNRSAFMIFSVAYCAAYGAFLVFPTQLPLGLFMIASILSPLLAATSHPSPG